MKQLDRVLQPEHKQAGLWLTEAPEDTSIINLIYNGNVIASFPASTITATEIREIANGIMIKHNNAMKELDFPKKTGDNKGQ